jgi:alpha-N-arabinofuranosidase
MSPVHARITTDPSLALADVDDRVFGSFVEHMGRCVYDGIHSPEHPGSDSDGFRHDVAEVVRELGPTILRYPGGNFVSGYDWMDGIGPREERPTRLDLAWRSLETNQVGTDEFIRYCRLVQAEPMMAVNLGTAGVKEAAALVEYCNVAGGTRWSDLRRAHGSSEPHAVKVWCLGNEMDGPWQLGHKEAEDYGRLAAQAALAMRRVDPSIELVACGTSKPIMPTFGNWEATVLRHTYHLVDHISLHMYVDPEIQPDRQTFLAAGVDIDDYVESVVASVDYARAVGRHARRMSLSFDEWNVWYNSRPRPIGEWPHAPRLIEDTYTLADALVVGSFLNSILRHADRVKMACLAQLVNVIAPIRTVPGSGEIWRQSTFYPFALVARHGRGGTSLHTGVSSPRHDTARHEGVPDLDVATVWHEDREELVLFVVNRSLERSLPLEIDLPWLARGAELCVEVTTLSGPDLDAVNGPEKPDNVVPSTTAPVVLSAGEPGVEVPAASWSMLRVRRVQ